MIYLFCGVFFPKELAELGELRCGKSLQCCDSVTQQTLLKYKTWGFDPAIGVKG